MVLENIGLGCPKFSRSVMLKTIVSYLILIVIVHFINWLATKHSGCHFFVLSSMPPLMFDFYWDQNVHVHVSSMGNHELRGLRGHGLVSHSWCRFPVTLSGPYTTKAQRKSFVSSPTIRAKISNSLTIAHICFLKLPFQNITIGHSIVP